MKRWVRHKMNFNAESLESTDNYNNLSNDCKSVYQLKYFLLNKKPKLSFLYLTFYQSIVINKSYSKFCV